MKKNSFDLYNFVHYITVGIEIAPGEPLEHTNTILLHGLSSVIENIYRGKNSRECLWLECYFLNRQHK